MKILIHRGAYGVIKKGVSLLLIKKSRGPYQGLYDLPGGRMNQGETEEEALFREVIEETGIVPLEWTLHSRLFHRLDYWIDGERIDFHHYGAVFTIHSYDESTLDLEKKFEDAEGARWVTIRDLHVMSPLAKQVCKGD